MCGGMEWSLGESIMNAMSQHGLTLFNIDNPTSARYVRMGTSLRVCYRVVLIHAKY